MSNTSKMPWPPPEGWPDCMICKDSGFRGSFRDGYFACGCPAGRKGGEALMLKVEKANAERKQMMTVEKR